MLFFRTEFTPAGGAAGFRRWFRALSDRQRLALLQDYVLDAERGACLNPAYRRIICEELRDRRYTFSLHTALPFSGRENLTSRIGHMWITIEDQTGTASIALGFYPRKRGLRNLLYGCGELRAESGRGHYAYGVISTAIMPEDMLRIIELARRRFSNAIYSVGGWFGGSDCTVFGAAACRLAGLVVPRRGYRLWTYWPRKRLEAMFHANRKRSGVRCILNPSAWENQRYRICNDVLRRVSAMHALLPLFRASLTVGRYVLPFFLLAGTLLAWAASKQWRLPAPERSLRSVGPDAT